MASYSWASFHALPYCQTKYSWGYTKGKFVRKLSDDRLLLRALLILKFYYASIIQKAKRLMVPDSYSQDDFVKSQPTNRQCVRCERVPRSPVRNECCRNLYCKPCSNRSVVCQQHKREMEFFSDSALRSKVRRLMVKCPNQERGCEWKGIMRQVADHLSECAGQ